MSLQLLEGAKHSVADAVITAQRGLVSANEILEEELTKLFGDYDELVFNVVDDDGDPVLELLGLPDNFVLTNDHHAVFHRLGFKFVSLVAQVKPQLQLVD